MRLAFAVLAIFAAGCARAPAAKRHVVEISGMTFQPARIEATRGDTIVFVNRDIVPHNATANHWKTADLAQGAEGRQVVEGSGEIAYRCSLHPVMEGKIILR